MAAAQEEEARGHRCLFSDRRVATRLSPDGRSILPRSQGMRTPAVQLGPAVLRLLGFLLRRFGPHTCRWPAGGKVQRLQRAEERFGTEARGQRSLAPFRLGNVGGLLLANPIDEPFLLA